MRPVPLGTNPVPPETVCFFKVYERHCPIINAERTSAESIQLILVI